jgi:hypothetical protein
MQKIRIIWSVFDLIWNYGWKACFKELNEVMEIKAFKFWNHVCFYFY